MSTSALSIAVSALRTHAYAIETTSHNVANAGTDGYRRQRVDLRTAFPRQSPIGPMGAGVGTSGVSRATDALADLRARGAAANASAFGARTTNALHAEDAFGEPDRGISTALAGAWAAFSALTVKPSDAAARLQVLSSLQDLAGRVNDVRISLTTLHDDTLARIANEVAFANDAAVRIAEINRHARGPDGLPADLADQRDLLLDQLAASVGARSEVQADGRVRVTVGGLSIVDADRAVALTLSTTPTVEITHPSGPVAIGGVAGGLLASVTTDLPGYRTQLDTFVTSLVAALNTTHSAGLTPAGANGGPLLADAGGVLSVVPASPAEIAAADAGGGAQNGRNADALANLRGPHGEALRAVITAVSTSVAGLSRSTGTAQSVADAAAQRRDSLVGVNLDEEMTQLVAQQRAYDAAARIVSVVDEMLQTLIAM